MTTSYVSIGIDIGKHFLDTHGLGKTCPARVANDADGIARLVKALMDASPNVIVCEPSGGYERPLVATLQTAGMPVVMVNAKRVRDFAKAKGTLAKTDRLDARILSEYGTAFRPEPRTARKPAQLAAYVQRRSQLVENLSREMRQRELACHPDIECDREDHIAWLQERIAVFDARIRACIEAEDALKERHAILTSCKSVGVITSATLMADIPELGTLSHSQITALAGLAPFNCDSGTRQGERHITGGKAVTRAALYMATLSAVRCNPDIKAFYERLRARGKRAKVALVAAMRKLLITLNALLRDNRKWQPLHD
jgi:transposase